jgi:DNA-binding transcriptional LysR family regulator
VAILNSTDLDSLFYAVLNQASHLCVLIRTNHPLVRHESIHVNDLGREPLLVRESGSASRQHLEQVTASAGITPRILLEFNSREGIKHAVTGTDLRVPQYVACPAEYTQLKSVRAFLEIVHEMQNISNR